MKYKYGLLVVFSNIGNKTSRIQKIFNNFFREKRNFKKGNGNKDFLLSETFKSKHNSVKKKQ